jgi:hypothetical protein
MWNKQKVEDKKKLKEEDKNFNMWKLAKEKFQAKFWQKRKKYFFQN